MSKCKCGPPEAIQKYGHLDLCPLNENAVREFNILYEKWVNANGSKSPSVKSAIQWTHEKLFSKLQKCADIVTCVKCPQQSYCSFAYDGYNTNGDCLADK